MKYVNEFITTRRSDGLAPGTLDQYERELRLLCNNFDKPSIEITHFELRIFLNQFSGMAGNTYARKISTMKAYYSWLTQEGMIVINPALKIKTPKPPELLPRFLTRNNFNKLRYLPKSIRDQAIIELLVSTGMRISEMTRLNRDDLDMDLRRIIIFGKGSKERVVFFSDLAKFCLLNYFSSRHDDNPALFINRYGDRLSNRSIEGMIKSDGVKAGIKIKVTPHRLRHTFATNLINNGADLALAQDLLGHVRADTTRIYCKLSEQHKMQMYDKYAAI